MAGVFGRYALLRSLGHGDMADVWKASLRGPAEFKKVFALKVLLQELSAGRDFIDVFVEEARVLASLSHPNIVQVTDFGEEAGRYFVATEFVHGKDLDAIQKRFVARGLRMPMEMALLIGVDLARALGAAHVRTAPDGSPILHREVFPKNVLVSYHGQVKLADFRSARVRSVAPAKLVYRSPEQTRGEALDRRSDLFALALLVLDLITGAKPGEGMPRDPATFAFPEKETAALSERAREILRKAVALDRDERYADAGELEAAFLELLSAKGLIEARRSLRSTLEKLFLEEMKAEAADDPAAPLPPAPADAPPPIARDTVSVPLTPRRKGPGDRPSGPGDRVSGSGGAFQAPPPPPAPPGTPAQPPRATPSGAGRVPVQPSPTANTAPGIGEAGGMETGSGAAMGAEMSTAPGIAKGAPASAFLDDEPGTVDGDPRVMRGVANLDPFSDNTESVRKPNATRVAQPSPSSIADLSGKPATPEPSRSFKEDLFPKEKPPANRTVVMAVAAGGGALVAAILGFVLVSFLFGGETPATTPTPAPTSLAVASPEQTAADPTPEATATPAKTAKPTATPKPAATPKATPTSKPATPRPTATRVAAITPKPPTPTPTPTPAPTAMGPSGEVTIRSKGPFVVYIDGKKTKLNTTTKVAAGPHKLRVVNDELEMDLPKDIDVPANGRVDIEIDADTGRIEVRKK